MTTDKTPDTLATVKHGGCVQLGGGLPPEGDAGAWVRSAYGQPSGFTYWNMEVAYSAGWQAALSAQPSPGGQGDALAAMPPCTHRADAGDLPGYLESDRDWMASRENAIALTWFIDNSEAIRAALAARQPDTDEQYADEQALIDHLDELMDDGGQGGEKWPPAQAAIAGIIAARQPVGEPVVISKEARECLQEIIDNCWRDEDQAVASEIDRLMRGSLYAAPTAQVGAVPCIDYEDLVDQAKDLIHCGCSVDGAFDWLLEQLTDGEAIAASPAQAVAADGFWLAVDDDGFVHFGQSTDDGDRCGVRENVESRINDWLDNDRRSVDLVWAGSAPAQAVDLGTGVKAIAAERERQLHAEGFTRDSDRQYQRGELAKAATAYVQLAAMDLAAGGTRDHIAWHGPAAVWPWEPEWWKPVDARRDLVRAGALIAAQIDLLDSQAVRNG